MIEDPILTPGSSPGRIGWRAAMYVADSLEEAELAIRGSLMFYGESFVRPMIEAPQDWCAMYYGGPWSGCFCSPITLARVRATL